MAQGTREEQSGSDGSNQDRRTQFFRVRISDVATGKEAAWHALQGIALLAGGAVTPTMSTHQLVGD